MVDSINPFICMTISRHRNLSDLEIAETEPSAADEMPIVIQLAQNDVANIQSSWTLIEPILLKVRQLKKFFKN